jgi:hypothetical protein
VFGIFLPISTFLSMVRKETLVVRFQSFFGCVVAVGVVIATSSSSAAQQWVVSPQYRPVTMSLPTTSMPISNFCQKCGRYHAVSQRSEEQPSVQRSQLSSPTNSSGGSSNVLSSLNAQRSRQGLNQLSPDPQLQAVAQRRAKIMAATGNKSHPQGSFSPGTYEGVGWSSSYSPSGVSACFTSDPRMRVAGAAMATGRDGVYFCVVYR